MTSIYADLVAFPIDENADVGAFVLSRSKLASLTDTGAMTYYGLADLEQAPLSSFSSRIATWNSLFQHSFQVLVFPMELLLSRLVAIKTDESSGMTYGEKHISLLVLTMEMA